MEKIVLFYIAATVIFNILAYKYINSRESIYPPLADVLHNYLPQLDNYYMNDVLTVSIFIFAIFNLTRQQVNKFSMIMIILYLLRAITMCVTHMPAVNENCKSALFDSCHDLMFSGHTTMTTVSLLALYYWAGWNGIFAILYYLATVFFILAQRRHYTSDVIIATILSVSIFHNLK